MSVKLVVNLKLKPTPEQHAVLLQTLERANAAANAASAVAWETQTFGQFTLHKLTYSALRADFGLSAQMAVRCIAKVADAYKADRKRQRTFRPQGGIALEDLKGIRDRVTARRRQRARLGNWPFFQLRSFVEYKARLAGVRVIAVDPANTSHACPECGVIDRANRRSQAEFCCRSRGFSALADHVAARNIRARAVVMRPLVAS